MYRDLGLIRVWGGESLDKELRGVPYAYLIYPHKPIVAYLPQTGRLLNEYCVEFPDESKPYGSARLPDSDDVLAKWMALKGDERRLISSANMHLPGRQVDPRQVQRDIWRLGRWERERLERHRRTSSGAAARARVTQRSIDGMSAAGNGHFDLKHRSRALTEGRDRAAARAYLKGIGYDDEALSKPIIGIANTWIETMPCNFHLRALAKHVKDGIKAAGGTPMEFNTVAISDGITMGTSRDEDEPGVAGGRRGLDRARDARPLLRRRDRAVRLRQDDPGNRDGARTPRRARRDALRRVDPARPLPGPRHHDHGRLRGGRRERGGQDHRPGPGGHRGRGQPRRRRLRRPVHGQHDGDGVRDDGHQPDRPVASSPRRTRRSPTSPTRPASS